MDLEKILRSINNYIKVLTDSNTGVFATIPMLRNTIDFIESQQETINKSYVIINNYLKNIQDSNIKLSELYNIIDSLKCCGNCMFDNTDTKNNGGCFGCKEIKDGVKLLHGWEPKENRVIKDEVCLQLGQGDSDR